MIDGAARRLLPLGVLLAAWIGPAVAQAGAADGSATLSAEQIVERNVAARGGLEAWRKIHAMRWTGHLDSATSESGSMRFVLDQARPNHTRFELDNLGQKSVRAFDGQHGWKLRPSQGIRLDVKPFSPEEDRFAKEAEVIDGPLIDYAAHGSQVRLGGLEDEHGRKAWRIIVTRSSGAQEVVWVDAETFLELRDDRVSYRSAGTPVTVTVYYQDFREFDGVQIPTQVAIGGSEGTPASRMRIEQVTLNPVLDEHAFESPETVFRHRAPSADRRSSERRLPLPREPSASTPGAPATSAPLPAASTGTPAPPP